MSLELYPSAEQSMLTEQNRLLEERKGDLRKLEITYQCFVEDSSLKGKGYSSAKELIGRAMIPAIRGIATYIDEFVASNSTVASALGSYSWASATHLSEFGLQLEYDSLGKVLNDLNTFDQLTLQDSYCLSIQKIRQNVLSRILQMRSYNSSTSGAYSASGALESINVGIKGALAAMGAALYNPNAGEFLLGGVDWSFEANLSGLDSLLTEEERLAISFYQSLPPELRSAISLDDIQTTGDGFVMCTKPMDKILEAMGISEFDSRYQDYYLWGLFTNEGFIHSILELRLPEYSDYPGLFIPFRTLDINLFSRPPNAIISVLDKTMTELFDSDNSENFSYSLLSYFANPESRGSYLLADIAINKALEAAGISGGGTWNPGTLATVLASDPHTAEALKKLEAMGIVDTTLGTINIVDAQNLSFLEKCAILACITSNPDIYSYAAENQFHANMFLRFLPGLKTLDENYVSPLADFTLRQTAGYIQNHAVVSSAGVTDSIGLSGSISEPSFKTSEVLSGSLISQGESYYDQQERTHSTNNTRGIMVS
ncbi:MAG: LXG domain-containing protein [Coriobacteriia bacterium]|nr:LXG domain-containing protein [Coriobacteriia bacterium]MCL2750325.1 LXG domain-containing protein [Coriobacteriia bacterium]